MDDYLKAHREGVASAAKKAAPKAPPKNPDDIPPRNLQDALDEVIRRKEDKAPTTKKDMGKPFKKGGYVRAADGCAKKGKTKGRIV
jgi:hypothetical protein